MRVLLIKVCILIHDYRAEVRQYIMELIHRRKVDLSIPPVPISSSGYCLGIPVYHTLEIIQHIIHNLPVSVYFGKRVGRQFEYAVANTRGRPAYMYGLDIARENQAKNRFCQMVRYLGDERQITPFGYTVDDVITTVHIIRDRKAMERLYHRRDVEGYGEPDKQSGRPRTRRYHEGIRAASQRYDIEPASIFAVIWKTLDDFRQSANVSRPVFHWPYDKLIVFRPFNNHLVHRGETVLDTEADVMVELGELDDAKSLGQALALLVEEQRQR